MWETADFPGCYNAKGLFRIPLFPGLGATWVKIITSPLPQQKGSAKPEPLSIFNVSLFSAVFTVTLCALQSHTPINK